MLDKRLALKTAHALLSDAVVAGHLPSGTKFTKSALALHKGATERIGAMLEEETGQRFATGAGEAAFYEAWKKALNLMGGFKGYFGPDKRQANAAKPSKWDLVPDVERIKQDMGPWSTGEQIYIACLVSFYNPATGQEMLNGLGEYANYVRALTRLDPEMREAITRLIECFPGW